MKILKFLVLLLVLAAGAGAAVAALAVWYFGRDLPDYKQLANYQPPIVTRVYAGDGRLMAEYATEDRIFVPVSAMPPLVIHAFLAAEDRNFYSHPGIDPIAMLRAAITDIARIGSDRRPEGASTITQQVAKNFLLSNEVSIRRKIKEALIAIKMERVLSKDRILELYLNEIYLGNGSYGVAAAALNYFNQPLDGLSIAQAAMLASLPKAPNNYNPERHPKAAQVRRDWVIDRMVDAGFITAAAGAAAKAQPIALHHRDPTAIVHAAYFTEEVRRELEARYGNKTLYEAGLAVRTSLDPRLQGFADHALRDALIAYDRRHGYRGPVTRIVAGGDWRVTLAAVPLPAGADDVGWKLAVVLAVPARGAEIGLADGTRGLIPYDELRWARRVLSGDRLGPVPADPAAALKRGDVVLVSSLEPAATGKGTPLFGLRQIPAVSGGIVALDPHTGRVLAATGGFSFAISQFDRATQAERQTGSAIKPLVYLAAVDHGFTPSTIVLDGPLVVDQGPGLPKWAPENYEHEFFGPVPLRVGLEKSLNLVTARVGLAVGVDTVGGYLKRFGVVDHVPHEDAMLIGAEDTTLLKLTAAYAMLDNGGKRITPTFIDRVQDRNGITIYRADDRPCDGCRAADWNGGPPPDLPDAREQIADPRSAYQVVAMMEGVIQRGTGRSIASLGRPLAGKTGTTNDSNDAWFVGFSPDLVCGVYVGFDQPRSLGRRETGATVAAPAFKEFMGNALKDQPAIPFRIPPGIEMVRVNAATGKLAQAGDRDDIYEPFKLGTAPTGGGAETVLDDVTGSLPAGVAAGSPAAHGVEPAASTAGKTATPQATPSTGTGGLY
ncbi:MAG TPA: penicillin-binding protein 1A [Stellaceae bacterium]|nr:penicillin-binding protein 1A [Stellaceae bacterium]